MIPQFVRQWICGWLGHQEPLGTDEVRAALDRLPKDWGVAEAKVSCAICGKMIDIGGSDA